MLGFHIDMNMAQFRRDYLEKWLKRLAGLGYDTVIWEVENNIKWETCPECASAEAFSKSEFAELVSLCRSLNLEPVPLLQTIAHCEYVLKHNTYAGLGEEAGCIEQYCPSKPDVREFLCRWIDEYLDLFGCVNYFHLGADEARHLGKCPICNEKTKEHGVGGLYIEHVNKLAKYVISKGVRPIIWADMLLSHPETARELSREIMLFDWMYDIYHGSGKVFVWGKGFRDKTTLEPETLKVFGKYLYPHGNGPGIEPQTFYTADYLRENGFEVVTCPSSSSYGDNVFSPRNQYHLANVHDSVRKGISEGMRGAVLTSWTVHAFPWELQYGCIDMAGRVKKGELDGIADLYNKFAREHFGKHSGGFGQACDLLSNSCIFTYTKSLGYNKSCSAVSDNYAFEQIYKLKTLGTLADELQNCKERLEEYKQGYQLLSLISSSDVDSELLEWWKLAAENLINRAKCSCILLNSELEEPIASQVCEETLDELRVLRKRSYEFYIRIVKPDRCAEMMQWIFGPIESAMTTVLLKQKCTFSA